MLASLLFAQSTWSQTPSPETRDTFAKQITATAQGTVDFGITFTASGQMHSNLTEHYANAPEAYIRKMLLNARFGKLLHEQGFTSFTVTDGKMYGWAEPCSEGFCQPKGPSNAPPPPEQASCNTLEEQLAYCKSWAADREEINVYCGTGDSGSAPEPNALPKNPPYCPQVLLKQYRNCENSSSGTCEHPVTETERKAAQQEMKDEDDKAARINALNAVRCTDSDPRSKNEQDSDPQCIELHKRQEEARVKAEEERKCLNLGESRSSKAARGFGVLGFAGGENEAWAHAKAQCLGFAVADCDNWRRRELRQTVCYRKGADEILALSFAFGLLIDVDYYFPPERFHELFSDFTTRMGTPDTTTMRLAGALSWGRWSDKTRNVTLDIREDTPDAGLDASALIENRCNPHPTRQNAFHVGGFFFGESVCDVMRKAAIPISKLEGVTRPLQLGDASTTNAEEMIEKLFKGASEVHNLVFTGGAPDGTLSQLWVFTKSPFGTELVRLTAQYGTPTQVQSKWSRDFGEKTREAIWVLPNHTSIDLVENGVQDVRHGLLRFTQILYLGSG